jgi:hypothetical protein
MSLAVVLELGNDTAIKKCNVDIYTTCVCVYAVVAMLCISNEN